MGINLFVELLQVSIGRRNGLSIKPSFSDWQALLKEAQRQTVVGAIMCGLERLPEDQRPPKELLLIWYGQALQIEGRNNVLNARCIELERLFVENGFNCCILKGQGNALLYPNPLSRQNGDIDIWVEGKVKDILPFLYYNCDMSHKVTGYHHVEFPLWNDVKVEVHWRPSWKSSPLYNRRIQRWFREQAHRQFVNVRSGLHVPTLEFNVVYLMQHMYLHMLQDGLGLRQVMDYYYLLKSAGKMELRDMSTLLRYLGLSKFAGAMMFVLQEAFGLEEKYMVVPIDEKRGRRLLGEIMKSGNFGQADERNSSLCQNKWISRSFSGMKRQYQFLKDYPGEVLCAPFRIYHVIWRKLKLWRWE